MAVGTAVPLILSAPGGPGTSFLRVASPASVDTGTTTTTTTISVVSASTTTVPAKLSGNAGPKATTPPSSVASNQTTPTSAPHVTSVPSESTPPSTSAVPPVGVATWCTAAQLGLSVATDRPSYNPGDTMQINVDAVNRSTTSCVLSDPTRTSAPSATCQPDTLVEAPYSAALPGFPVVAEVGPGCNGTTHLLAGGDAWHTLMTVVIPADGSWSAGTYTVHSEWQAPGELVSANTAFDLTGSPTTTTTTPTTTPPTTDTTTTLIG